MDARSLQDLWNGPSPFLAQMGEQEFNLNQQKRQADLATVLGMEQRNQAMHPVEIEAKKAVTDLNKSTTALNQYSLDTKLPKEQALRQNMQKFFKESDEMTQEQTRMQVQRMMQIASMAKNNGGVLPPGIQLSPEEIKQYSPANLDKIIKYGETFFASDPKEIAARQRAAEAIKLAQTKTEGQVQVKQTGTPQSGGGTPTNPSLSKMNWEQQYGYYNNLANQEKDPQKKAAYQAEADRIELMILRRAVSAAQARKQGEPDLSQFGSGIPTMPAPTLTPTPRSGQPAPAQPQMTLGKLQELYPGVPPDKLKEAFKKKFGVDVQ